MSSEKSHAPFFLPDTLGFIKGVTPLSHSRFNLQTHEQRIESYWADFFGVPAKLLASDDLYLVPHCALRDYDGAWIFRHEKADIISLPPQMIDLISKDVVGLDRQRLMAQDFLERLFPTRIERFVGPAYQGSVSVLEFKSMNTHSASRLKKKDAGKLKSLASACGKEAWGHASIDFSDDHLFVCEKGGIIVAAANFKHKSPTTVAIGIATHPEHRGKGYAKSAASAAIQNAHELGYLVTYQTLENNLGSIAVANSLGFKQFGQSMAVRFK